jgi:hypothetical protein
VSRASAGETIKNYGFSFHAEDLQVSELWMRMRDTLSVIRCRCTIIFNIAVRARL